MSALASHFNCLMTVTVFSDSHGRVANVEKMMARAMACSQKPSEVLFLGDGLSDLAAVEHPIVAVRGNCDMFFSADVPEERVLVLGGYRILMCHGHTLGVKYGLAQALAAAERADADILLYGHTHERHAETFAAGKSYMGVKFEKTLHVFNPGSLADGYFGCLTLRDNGVLMSHGELYDR